MKQFAMTYLLAVAALAVTSGTALAAGTATSLRDASQTLSTLPSPYLGSKRETRRVICRYVNGQRICRVIYS